jgi:hypothetical protein
MAKQKQITPVKARIVSAASEILADQPDSLNYQHSILCQVGLPRKRVPGDYFERRSGNAILSVQAGKYFDGKNMVLQPVPYGPKARLALGYIHSYAKWADSPIIPAGDSARDFLDMIGLTSADGRTMKLVKQHAVPYDPRAFVALAHSALAQDVYLLLCYRLHCLNAKGIKVTWQQWKEQFGQEYQGKRALQDFKDKFVPAVKAALAVYPDANVRQVTGGLMLMPSRPPAPLK